MRKIFFILILCSTGKIFSQQSAVDDAVQKLGSLPDSSIAIALCDSSHVYRFDDFDLSYRYAQGALHFATKANVPRMIGNAYNYSGIAQQLMGHYPQALKNYTNAEETFRKAGIKKGLASTYLNIGVLNQDLGNDQGAIDYTRKAYAISLEFGDNENAASALNNIATLHSGMKNWDSALYYNLQSLAIREKIGKPDVIATSLSNIGTVYDNTGQYDKALEFHLKALAMDSAAGNLKNVCIDLSNLSSTLIHLDRNAEAKSRLLRAYALADSIDYPDIQLDIIVNLMSACENLGQMKEAVDYSKKYVSLKDTVVSRDTRDAFGEMQAKLDNTVQKHEIENLHKDEALRNEKLRRQTQMIWLGAGILFLVLVLLVFILRGFIQKKKANAIITEQKAEVEQQKNLIETKNHEMLDSINYAQRIQQALLLPEEEIKKDFSDAFVLFQPKDIVSGDFYWYAQSEENKILALADCTGHGVPGGFMSMLGYEMLQDVILREEVQTTSEAMTLLDKKVTDTLNKNSKTYRDGMDMALIAFNKKTGKMQYSGANRSLIFFSNGEMKIFQPDKLNIGGAIDEVRKNFTKTEVAVKKGDVIFLLTDGYADQFGGKDGKKFKTKNLLAKLKEIHSLPMSEQKIILEKTFSDWKGDLEQVDDVSVIGLRI